MEPDWRRLFERERGRAERERARAEARCEELRLADVDSRARAGSLKWQLDACRRKLKAAVEEAKEVRRTAKVSRLRKEAIRLNREVARLADRLDREAEASETHEETIRWQGREVIGLHAELRRLRDQADAVRCLSEEVYRLRVVLEVAEAGKGRLKARQLRASEAARLRSSSCEAAELRKALRRSRRQKTAIKSLSKENARLRKAVRKSESRQAGLEVQLAKLRATGAVLSKALLGRRNEQQERPRSERRRCNCASSPVEVSALPAPRLFAHTPCGTSVWSRFLFERYACFRPLHRVASWLSGQGLPISPGTLAGSVHRFVPLFEPVARAILAHQNEAAVRHGDETNWRVQSLREEGRSSRAWLWTSVSEDAVYFHIDPSRSAEVAKTLFCAVVHHTVIVCDRYSAYKKMARMPGGLVTLAWCWSHMRRDFIHCAAGQVQMTPWCRGWIERIASIYRLNEARLVHYDPGRARQGAAFDAAQGELKAAVDGLFAEAEGEFAGLPAAAREGKALRSLLNHREGLSVFIDRPQAPMDNNAAERALRGPAIERRLSFGSDSETGARFTALMYSVLGTLASNGIDLLRWLEAWLGACAANGGRPPDDLSPWLPWSMSEDRRRALMTPG